MNVMADWTYMISSINADFYVDKTDIRKKSNKVKMWDMTDYKSTQQDANGASYLSSRSLAEYDCVQIKYATLNYTFFSGNMGDGEVVANSQYNGEPIDIAPDSVAKKLWKTACGKK
jgi:hypothetical protein